MDLKVHQSVQTVALVHSIVIHANLMELNYAMSATRAIILILQLTVALNALKDVLLVPPVLQSVITAFSVMDLRTELETLLQLARLARHLTVRNVMPIMPSARNVKLDSY